MHSVRGAPERGARAATSPPSKPAETNTTVSSDNQTAIEPEVKADAPTVTFADLGLSQKVLSAVTDAGYVNPTPIQAGAIPHALQGKDVLGIAQTGTGKTAAFVLPMITRLEKGRARARMPRTLILEPTRELAAQVDERLLVLRALAGSREGHLVEQLLALHGDEPDAGADEPDGDEEVDLFDLLREMIVLKFLKVSAELRIDDGKRLVPEGERP